jgi:ATP-dependent DNA helicase RecQ
MNRAEAERILRERFGFDGFREGQYEAVEALMSHGALLAVFPTGYGKSLLYQFPAAILPGITVVFSPLIALMKDQRDRLANDFGMPTVALHWLMGEREGAFDAAIAGIRGGRYKIVFVAPERLDDLKAMESILSQRISLIVVDEAHCISQWGHDFRPHYRRIIDFVRRCPDALVLGLTATAPPQVVDDVCSQLGRDCAVHRMPSSRPNLKLHNVRLSGDAEKCSAIVHLVRRLEGSGVVYVGTHEECEKVSGFLNHVGIRSEYYHGKLREFRHEIQDGFMQNKWKVTVATNALGMGIDKPDIRFIIHYRFPSDIESYYQEIGRAGRDGKTSHCVLLFDEADVDLQEYFIESACPARYKIQNVLDVLDPDKGVNRREVERRCGYQSTETMNILAILDDCGAVERTDAAARTAYRRLMDDVPDNALDFHVRLREARRAALDRMMEYGVTAECLMQHLCRYLGDAETSPCGRCTSCKQYTYEDYVCEAADAEAYIEDWNPILPPAGASHQGGFALEYHKRTFVGEIVSACKYAGAGPIPEHLVESAAAAIERRFAGIEFTVVASIPSTSGNALVEDFARRLAVQLGAQWRPLLANARGRKLQKDMLNKAQKEANIKGAFGAQGTLGAGESILLVDDIFDTGWTLREAAKTLRKAHNPGRINVFTLTKTRHADDL